MIGQLTPEAIAIIGIFLGVAARSFLPYIRKTVKENIPLKWEHRYTGNLILSIIITVLVYPTFQIPVDSLAVFVGAFIFGWGFDSILTEAYQWIRVKKAEG